MPKELKLLFPNCTRVNRGNLGMSDVVEMCRANQVTDMIIVHETRGEPDGLLVSHLPAGPTAYFGLYNCVLRHDIRSSKVLDVCVWFKGRVFSLASPTRKCRWPTRI